MQPVLHLRQSCYQDSMIDVSVDIHRDRSAARSVVETRNWRMSQTPGDTPHVSARAE